MMGGGAEPFENVIEGDLDLFDEGVIAEQQPVSESASNDIENPASIDPIPNRV
jgi:hypothetical protein